jgi:GAF domain-containing protein
LSKRRSVDWPVILGGEVPASVPSESRTSPQLARLLSATDELVALDDVDIIARRAVELARSCIGLDRVGLFLLDEAGSSMLGTWGTDLQGEITDEHHVMYELGQGDREAYQRAVTGVARWTVFEDCPIVVHLENETRWTSPSKRWPPFCARYSAPSWMSPATTRAPRRHRSACRRARGIPW